jgi:hypothetical protein
VAVNALVLANNYALTILTVFINGAGGADGLTSIRTVQIGLSVAADLAVG